jgi:hypothetical protein
MKRFTQFDFNHVKNNIILENTEEENEDVTMDDISLFFSKLFESKEMAHVYHLQVKGDAGSYAKHMALGEYYESILELIDSLIEVYQGQYDIVKNYEIIDTNKTNETDSIAYFMEIANFITNERKCISDKDTHLHSLIDDILCLIYKTLYKLKFNK